MGSTHEKAAEMDDRIEMEYPFDDEEIKEYRSLKEKFAKDTNSLTAEELTQFQTLMERVRTHRRDQEAARQAKIDTELAVRQSTIEALGKDLLEFEYERTDLTQRWHEQTNHQVGFTNPYDQSAIDSSDLNVDQGATFTRFSSVSSQLSKAAAEQRLDQIQEYLIKYPTKPQLNVGFELQDNNWREWNEKIREGLDYFELTEFVTGQFPASVYSNQIFVRYNRLTVGMLRAHLSPNIKRYVGDEPNASQLYRILRIRGEGNKVNRMVSVVNDWYDAVQQFQSMDHLINALRELIRMFNQIKSARDPDALWCAFFLAALPNEFAHLRTTLSGLQRPSLDSFFSQAIQEWNFRKQRESKKPVLVHHLNRKPGNKGNSGGSKSGKQPKAVVCDLCSEPHALENCALLKKLTGVIKKSKDDQQGTAGGSDQDSSNQQSNSNNRCDSRNQADDSSADRQTDSNDDYQHNNLIFNQQQQRGQRTLNAGGLLNDSFAYDEEPVIFPENPLVGFHISVDRQLIKPLDDDHKPTLSTRELVNDDERVDYPSSPACGIYWSAGHQRVQMPDYRLDRYELNVTIAGLRKMVHDFQTNSKVCNVRLRPEELTGFIVDSGANDHFVHCRMLCYVFKPMDSNNGLTTADGSNVPIDGIGHVKLKSTLGPILKLKNCVVCSKLKGNFVSASKLDEENGMFVLLGNRRVRIIYEGKIIMVGNLTENRLYRLQAVDEVPKTSLFHVRVLSNEEKQFNEHRALGKRKALPFSDGQSKSVQQRFTSVIIRQPKLVAEQGIGLAEPVTRTLLIEVPAIHKYYHPPNSSAPPGGGGLRDTQIGIKRRNSTQGGDQLPPPPAVLIEIDQPAESAATEQNSELEYQISDPVH